MRIFILTATYELRVRRKSHLRDHPIPQGPLPWMASQPCQGYGGLQGNVIYSMPAGNQFFKGTESRDGYF
jgi:hypothetical protein